MRALTRSEVVALCRERLEEMERERYWGPAMAQATPAQKCAWMLRHLHVQLRATQACTFPLEEALCAWAGEIITRDATPGLCVR